MTFYGLVYHISGRIPPGVIPIEKSCHRLPASARESKKERDPLHEVPHFFSALTAAFQGPRFP